MRIAMYTDSFYPYPSGVSTAVLILAEELAQKGHTIFIQAPRPKETPDLEKFHPNIEVHYVPSTEIFIYPDFRIGTKNPLNIDAVRHFNPDLIHIHTPLSIGLEGIFAAKRLHKPVVQTFHTYYMDQDLLKLLGVHNERLARFLAGGGWKLAQRIARLTQASTVPSQYVLEDFRNHNMPEPVFYCPNMLPHSVYAQHPRRKGDVQSFMYVGRLSPEKNVDILISAFAQLISNIHDESIQKPTLNIIGDGPERESLVNLAFDLGIASFVRWHGKKPYKLLIQDHLYHQSDVFIMPGKSETFGYTLIEAMAHGLPVIAFKQRATPEIIGEAGWLIEDTNDRFTAIERLTNTLLKVITTDISEYRKKAYQQSQQYKPEFALDSYLDMYTTAIEMHSLKQTEIIESEIDTENTTLTPKE